MDSALELLLRRQPALWRGHEQRLAPDAIDTGFALLNQSLPGGGWVPGTLTELLVSHPGSGEVSLLLPALRNLTVQQQWTALVSPPHIPYAPALASAGLQLDRVLIVASESGKDTLWATEQLLRSGVFGAVICWVNQTTPRQQRRLQLAAEAGHAWAVAYRPAAAAAEHSPAALRIRIIACPPELSLDILKARGGQNRNLRLRLSDFDAPQGHQWPAFAADDTL